MDCGLGTQYLKGLLDLAFISPWDGTCGDPLCCVDTVGLGQSGAIRAEAGMPLSLWGLIDPGVLKPPNSHHAERHMKELFMWQSETTSFLSLPTPRFMLPMHVSSGLQLQGEFLNLTSHLELNLARAVRGNKKGFDKYIRCKRKTEEGVGPLLNVRGGRGGTGNRGHKKNQGTQCLLHFSLHW